MGEAPFVRGVYHGVFGVGMALDTKISIVASPALPTAALVYRINVEEAAIAESSMGPAYANYADGRARLVPRIW